MTLRAGGLIVLALAGLYAGAIREQALLSLLSLSTILWVLLEWLRFQAWICLGLPQARIVRKVNGRDDATSSLWAGRRVPIELHVRSNPKYRPLIRVREVVPDMLEILAAADSADRWSQPHGTQVRAWDLRTRIQGWFTSDTRDLPPHEWSLEPGLRQQVCCYTATVRAAGQLTLPGIHLTLSDPYRFFRVHRFIAIPQTFRVLPDYLQSGKQRPTVKRYNSLPRHGIHRLQRSGAGSELLELREYVVGDPPKSIAWKVSARRGKLMTREYESEVPVRVHLFIDGSASTRIGGYGKRLLDQINYAAASVAKAAISVGDPVTATLINEGGGQRLNWLSGDRGFLQLLKALADFAHGRVPATQALTADMLRCASSVCHERFPELLERPYHRIPFALRPAARSRFRLVGALAEVLSLSPRQQVACYYDSSTLAHHVQEFLYLAGTPWVAPLRAFVADPAAIGVQSMARLRYALAAAIARARDNEVFVVFADPVSCGPNLPQLVRVVRLAVAKHHRVVFICPTATGQRPYSETTHPRSESVADFLQAAEQTRTRELATQMRRELVRLGVAVSFSGDAQAMRTVMAETELARDGRTRRQWVKP